MWWCPQLHVDRLGCSNPCRCQLCYKTLGGIYLTVAIEDSMKKKIEANTKIDWWKIRQGSNLTNKRKRHLRFCMLRSSVHDKVLVFMTGDSSWPFELWTFKRTLIKKWVPTAHGHSEPTRPMHWHSRFDRATGVYRWFGRHDHHRKRRPDPDETGVTVCACMRFACVIMSGYLVLANQHTSSEGQGSRDLRQTRVEPYWIEIVGHSSTKHQFSLPLRIFNRL